MQNQAPTKGRINYMNVDELAAELGISRRRLQDWTRAGLIPSIKVGNKHFYDPETVNETLKQRAA